MNAASDIGREAERQQRLLAILWRRQNDAALALWCRDDPTRTQQGLAAYRGNAAAIAARALAAAYPTVQQLIGEEAFELLARALWHRHPPERGDLAHWGAELADFIADDAQLADEPYLADVARVDWAVHRLEHAADAPSAPEGLERLASDDPARLRLQLQPGASLLHSAWPVASIRLAHRRSDAQRFDAVRAAFASRRGESVWIWRDVWRATVQAISASDAAFTAAVLRDASLAEALERAGDGFSFETWLRDAITHQWLAAVRPLPEPPSSGELT